MPVQDLSKFRLPRAFRGRSALTTQIWWIVQATLFRGSPQAFYGWRRALLRMFGARIGRRVLVRPTVRITYPWKVEIGDYSWIGDQVDLYSLGPIIIGKNAVISQGSYLCTGTHDHTSIDFPIKAAVITVEDEAWIAARAFVHPGVTIGRGAVVGACSVVFADVPAMTIVAGNPARPRGPRAAVVEALAQETLT